MAKEKADQDEIAVKTEEWLKEIEDETDRGAAVLVMAFVEEQLDIILKQAFAENKQTQKQALPHSFAAKMGLARALGIISAFVYDELKKLSEIRNKFAHQLHGRKFHTPEIANLCKQLLTPHHRLLKADTHRERFLVTALFIARYIQLRCKCIVRPEAPVRFHLLPTPPKKPRRGFVQALPDGFKEYKSKPELNGPE